MGPTEVRSRWTKNHLYLLYICPYKNLYLNANPVRTEETNKLWDRDVAEAFLGTASGPAGHYKEFEVSPQGEFVDLDIDRDQPASELGIAWQSGFVVRARVDAEKKIWYAEMRIPFASLGLSEPKAGDELRAGLYRIEGAEPKRIYVTWQPTGKKSFHVPSSFGRLVLR
ncbi:MAG: carbohydrate-binding family 9-like protein [Acidobacteriota bacterium]